MLKIDVIGFLGADVEIKDVNGKKFANARVAHTRKWKDANAVVHEATQWVDLSLSAEAKVLPFLKKGTQVYARGSGEFRAYSSAVDKCYKAGVTIYCDDIVLLTSPKEEKQSQLQKEIEDGKVF